MKYMWMFISLLLAGFLMPTSAQQERHRSDSRAELEKQLWSIEQQWLGAEGNRQMDFLKELWTDQFFDVLPGGRMVGKEEMLNLLRSSNPKPGTGAFPDDFKLQAVYGNVALATDHTTIKSVDANGQLISTEIRALRLFAKENGKWKVAGAALVPISPLGF